MISRISVASTDSYRVFPDREGKNLIRKDAQRPSSAARLSFRSAFHTMIVIMYDNNNTNPRRVDPSLLVLSLHQLRNVAFL